MVKYFLGVDGGGSKTEFLILNDLGEIAARHLCGSSYYLQIGVDGLEKLLYEGTQAACDKAKIATKDLEFSFFGLPAFGEDMAMENRLKKLPSEFLNEEKYSCGNDMVCGWAGSLACQDGINIVAGTGSIAYGENNGKAARAGGFGELFGDEGSAYWIGICTLNLYSKMADGRIKPTVLFEIVNDNFAIKNPLDICAITMGPPQMSRDEIGAISRLCYKAACLNDTNALEIFSKAAAELALTINALTEQLGFGLEKEITLSYSGGVFNAKEIILDRLMGELGAKGRKYNLIEPKFTPAIGAALYAARLSSNPFSSECLLKIPI